MRTGALIKRICQQMLRDKRTLALLFVAPLLVLTLMYFLFASNAVAPTLGVVNVNPTLVQVLEKANVNVRAVPDATKERVVQEQLDGVLQSHDQKLELTLENSDPSKAKLLQMLVNQAAVAAQLPSKSNPTGVAQAPSIATDYVYGNSETSFFDVLSPVLVGFFVFFFVFLISGIGLLRERTTGTLERIMSTPIRRGEVITGYLAGYGIFAIIQTVIVVLYAINVLDMTLVGSIWHVLLINLLLALVALSLGILLSTFAASEFQMVQFIPVVVIPQIFFAGIFPIEGMATWLQALSKIMPLYYGADALKGIMYQGATFREVSGDIVALVVFAAVFIVLNTFALKKYRRL
ncbi:ABC transporter permease [Tumebacillus permanentifrigoris]|uniref:ABC-2 type transport system permease protein n=1 Tax=Tumebacillus permanentifrigoris TaxID=378543 RepID=A0A316DFQ5_9BACL|nr:ABC transporter permease [Tumebacillus permanentifrigoris]PWK15004.1 ABC-2 type transport system permease protein [Tumebacillus permanentifrigoris]